MLCLLRRWLSLSSCARYCSLPVCRPAGPFSCLSDNHWNQIQVLIIIHLPTVSPLVSEPALPLARSAFPRPPRHIPPPPVSGRGALRHAGPPPIPREEVGYRHPDGRKGALAVAGGFTNWHSRHAAHHRRTFSWMPGQKNRAMRRSRVFASPKCLKNHFPTAPGD